jgi:hypothetical protein
MATVDVIANRSTASEILGKAYFETDTNSFIVYNGSGWVELQSDGTGAAPPFNQYSVDLDGTNNYIDVGGSYDLGTFSAWFKPDSTLTATSSAAAMASFTGVNPYGSAAVLSVGGHISGAISNEIIALYTGDYWHAYTSATDTINTNWHHVALLWTGSTYDIYLDGSSVKNASGTFGGSLGNVKIPISDLSIGRRNNNTSFFPGLVDEVAIWSTELSASDITDIYNSGVPTDISSLSPAGWWRMGEDDSGTGTTITDQGSGGNDGTLVNGPTFSSDVPS